MIIHYHRRNYAISQNFYLNFIKQNIFFTKPPNFLGIVLSIFIITSIFYSYSSLHAQEKYKSNLEVFEDEISIELEKIIFLPEINRNEKFVFYVTDSGNKPENKKFMEKIVRNTADKNKILYSFSKDDFMKAPDTGYIKFRIIVNKFYTEYTKLIKNRFLGEKTMYRKITSAFSVNVWDNFDKSLYRDDISTKFEDEIPLDDYTKYESAEYKFTQNYPPKVSFLESVIFPAAVVTFSAIAAILFFTIRSK